MALGALGVGAGPALARPGPHHGGQGQPSSGPARGGRGGGGGGGGNGVFLCYSKSQTVPGVWGQGQAAQLLAEGYFLPAALRGNVDGGTNLGDFHLQCNA